MSDAVLLDAIWNADTVYRPDLFAGKTALVSGGGSGIGRATALLLARLGARVVITGRTQEKLDRVVAYAASRGVTLHGFAANVREHEQVLALYERVEAEVGLPDVLINSAGGQFPQPAIEFSPKGWNAVVSNNLNSTWFMMQRAAQRWRDTQRPGSIVNVIVVTERGMPGVAHTVAARAGIVGATRTVAVEWAPLNIRINCVAPGLTASEGLAVYPPEAVAEFPRANPMKRPGTPLEIAQACVFLAAPSASFITGEVLTVDGGGKLWGELWLAGRPDYYRD
ncbi:citronellol/citronellal dehydrogenase [Solimonas aquatica]|uniref:Peroxisomal trans-2-enoyl-CoA reductase n=1 Tax=Solimonas aquatica TaxID=489703 RepID=A0A1H9J4A7_9GAMM|nr:SDR family oxidoreductase [Solimonas aquatica]SEQ81618.1 citronellol/citronellal dehydrogenase [Solimonas aquatica]